jgi:uncharacterized protein (DUF433 family)
MALVLEPELSERVPLTADERGVVYIGGTRAALEIAVEAYRQGDTAEEIATAYSSLNLADVHAVITYYLRHKEAVEQYVEERRQDAAALCAQIEAEFDPRGIRERLLARRATG